MSTGAVVGTILMFTLAVITLVISVLQFMQKGFVFNNSYWYETEEIRREIDKKPYYMQTAVVFMILTIAFVLSGINYLTGIGIFRYLGIAMYGIAIAFGVVSSVVIEKKDRKKA